MKHKHKKNLLITGKPKSGKSTLVQDIIADLDKNNVGGFITKEIRVNDIRTGFELVALGGDKGLLANKDFKSNIRVGKFGVDINTLENIGISEIDKALRDRQLVVIDEIGNMQIASNSFCNMVKKALKSDIIFLATIHIHDNEFTDNVKERSDVEIFNLDNYDRNNIKQEILKIINQFI